MQTAPAPREVAQAVWALLGVLAASLALVSAQVLVVGVTATLALLLAFGSAFSWRRAGRLLLRMKWFYLSLLVFYGLWPTGAAGMVSGMGEAIVRILALMVVVLLVVWLTEYAARPVLVRALGAILGAAWRGPGNRGERFARRLFLALAYFESEQEALQRKRHALSGSRKARLAAVREWLVVRLDQALAGAWEEPPLASGGHGSAAPRAGSRWPVVVLWLGVAVAWLLWWWL
ncbi:hypothetical protein [Thioalkalivibrio sp. ALJ16]|uniref:hypothetical protein n=1 Tax=Thioalkalivibrio sp. ALJ16 TaxID=1158762 RepID=UPI000375B416|nr:hypothetical protein [Thioalkalivibrio sp. ALJ16]